MPAFLWSASRARNILATSSGVKVLVSSYALVIVFPEWGGTPGCRWGNWGLCGDSAAYLCLCGGGNEGPLIYYAQTREKYWDFASAKAQGNWEQAFIVLYTVNQPWGTFTVNVLEDMIIKTFFFFCRTITKTKQVSRTKLLF